MIRAILFGIHALMLVLCLVGFCISVAQGDPAFLMFLPVVLLAGMCYGLWRKSRWTLVLSIAVTALSALLAAALVMGNITAHENVVFTVFFFLLCLELATMAYVIYMLHPDRTEEPDAGEG